MDELLSPAGSSAGDPSGVSRGIMERIRQVFVQSLRLQAGEAELPHEQMLEEAASLDSVAVLEFMTALEKEFGIAMEPEYLEFDFLRDFSQLAAYVEERMGGLPGVEARGESER